MSSYAWGEVLCGPLDPQDQSLAKRLVHRFLPVRMEESSRGAELFNLAGRRRRSFADCVIAATAILGGAALATTNPKDFERFLEAGLVLAD
jgi:predicted nucleic acid-binding protein